MEDQRLVFQHFMFVNRLCCKENKMDQTLTIEDDYLDFKLFSKRPILIRQVSADMLSLISYKTAKNNLLMKQSSKYFKELNVSALMKGSHGSLNKQAWVSVRKFSSSLFPKISKAGTRISCKFTRSRCHSLKNE